MQRIYNLAQKHEFDYGFVNEFSQNLNIDHTKISKVAALATDPTIILPNCKTVIVLAFKHEKTRGNVASFAYGEDYHNKIREVGKEITPLFKDGTLLVDTHKLNERYFAKKSGIGFIGKNSMFISDKYGSYCHLALILTTEYIENTRQSLKTCGSCSKCISSCPVNAIENQIDCNKCISEKLQLRNNFDFKNLVNVYGCDECQVVCPHNKVDKTDLMLYNEVNLVEDLHLTKNEFMKYKNQTFFWIGYRSYIRNVHVAYVNRTGDLSKLEFLDKSESDYLRNVSRKLREEG